MSPHFLSWSWECNVSTGSLTSPSVFASCPWNDLFATQLRLVRLRPWNERFFSTFTSSFIAKCWRVLWATRHQKDITRKTWPYDTGSPYHKCTLEATTPHKHNPYEYLLRHIMLFEQDKLRAPQSPSKCILQCAYLNVYSWMCIVPIVECVECPPNVYSAQRKV